MPDLPKKDHMSERATTSPPPPVDTRVFEQFAADVAGADGDARRSLIDTYLDDARPRIADLLAASGRDDAAGMGTAAHGLRSGSALLGALPLADLLQQLETAARSGAGGLRSIVADIQVAFGAVVVTLEQLRGGAPPPTG